MGAEFIDVFSEFPSIATTQPPQAVQVEEAAVIRERKAEPGRRYDVGKLRFDLVPPEWERALAEVLTRGASKYSERNWEAGMSYSRCYAAVRRHLNAFWSGKDVDAESGLHHLAHAAWGCLAILSYVKTHPEFDDRVKEARQ